MQAALPMSDTRTQVRFRPVIWVFASSIPRGRDDIKNERNALLVEQVFPKLEDLSLKE
jgi:hypothetical protein